MKTAEYEISIERVAKYLGQKVVSEVFIELYEQAKKEVLEQAMPKTLCLVCQAEQQAGFYFLKELGITLKSNDVNKLFYRCDKIAVLATTIGAKIDKTISAYQQTDMLMSTFMDACASVLVEEVSEKLKKDLIKQFPQYHTTMSYSPGYGDLGLEMQGELIEKLQAEKLIGVRTNEQHLMIPLKSITAFVGLSSEPQVFCDTCLSCKLKGQCRVECNKVKI